MKNSHIFTFLFFTLLSPSIHGAESDKAFYEQQVKPLLEKHCLRCHGAKPKIRGGLRLTSREGILKGGDTGPAVSTTHPEKSLLIDVINYRTYEMPPSNKLSQKDIDTLTKWVKLDIPGLPAKDEIVHAEDGPPQVNEKTKKFWSFQSVKRPSVPRVPGHFDIENPIDAFIASGLTNANLSQAPRVQPTELIRRMYYDVIGLPPTPEQVSEFTTAFAKSPQSAVESLVDQLLASPHFGEKWGRHWLDLVRYAETNSYERDGPKPFVWRYRDYVIRAFNDDKPYNQFILEQLAGDELPKMTRDSLIATGYYRLGIWDDEPVDPVQAFYDDMDDILATTSQVFLGLTINCARCHDHKLDPIPQSDYYRMLAFFSGINRFGIRGADTVKRFSLRPLALTEEDRKEAREAEIHKQRLREVTRRIGQIERKVRRDFEPVEKEEFRAEAARIDIVKKRVPRLLSQKEFDEYVKLMKEHDHLRQHRPKALELALCVTEIGPKPRDMHILIRGNPHVKGKKVKPGFLSVLTDKTPAIPKLPEGAKTSGQRLALAQWIADDKHPLTARVMVNRIWQFYFGQGIVRSSSNFGLKGEKPSHPQLLDWLASELIDNHWQMKALHRQILLSRTYQTDSRPDSLALEKDPENRFLSHQNMRRLGAEEVRDSILAVSGNLNRGKMFGPSIYPIIPKEVLAGQSRPGSGWSVSPADERFRRSVYVHIKRSLLVPILESFDAADTDFSCPVRFATTQPTQALGLLNSEFLNTQSQTFAEDLINKAGTRPRDQVQLALKRVFQRTPTDKEILRGVSLIEVLQREHGLSAKDALSRFCLVALNINEFYYLD